MTQRYKSNNSKHPEQEDVLKATINICHKNTSHAIYKEIKEIEYGNIKNDDKTKIDITEAFKNEENNKDETASIIGVPEGNIVQCNVIINFPCRHY